MTLSELERYLCRGDFRVEGDGERIWLEGPEGWRLAADDPPDTRLVLADEPDILRKMLPTLQCLHVLDRIASALTVCRGISTSELRRAAHRLLDESTPAADCELSAADAEESLHRPSLLPDLGI